MTYEEKAKALWGLMKQGEPEEYKPNVISYFVKRNPNEPEITGKIKLTPETHYDKVVSTEWAIKAMQDLLFTKKKTKGRRITLRKAAEQLKPWEEYNYLALIEYLREAHSGGFKKVLLSWQELKLLKGE